MPGRDTTRLRNRAASLFLFTLVICAAVQLALPAWPQAASQSAANQPAVNQDESKPATPPAAAASPAPTTSVAAPTPNDQSKPPQEVPAQDRPSQPATSQTAPPQENPTKDQGVFVFRKDVDEVLLHASVVDDKQHIVTNLDRDAF